MRNPMTVFDENIVLKQRIDELEREIATLREEITELEETITDLRNESREE